MQYAITCHLRGGVIYGSVPDALSFVVKPDSDTPPISTIRHRGSSQHAGLKFSIIYP